MATNSRMFRSHPTNSVSPNYTRYRAQTDTCHTLETVSIDFGASILGAYPTQHCSFGLNASYALRLRDSQSPSAMRSQLARSNFSVPWFLVCTHTYIIPSSGTKTSFYRNTLGPVYTPFMDLLGAFDLRAKFQP